jgi:hypothetical protein
MTNGPAGADQAGARPYCRYTAERLGDFSLYPTGFQSLRVGFRTEWPRPFEVVGFRVIGPRADGYVIAGLAHAERSVLKPNDRRSSRRTSDVGARGKHHGANHWSHQE